MIKLLLLIIFTTNVIISKSQDIEFFREDITFKISKTYFNVDGLYYFCNVSNKNLDKIIYYPFPIDSLYGNIDSVFVETEDSLQIKFINNQNKGIYIKIHIEDYGIKKIRIKYRQQIYKNKAEYILTTTKYWKKPFEIVNYKLIVPKEINISSISYRENSVYTTKSKRIYLWQKKDFMPTKNMIISFE